ncbi:glycosyltransferase family 87 protein [Aurantibacillus circumpalustris]|uniref:glycosyltransferase family 87 protein n=1 Tax=Aurantibacillus circumpalustris TaxID=3036359 RepID=UPI00295A5A73|nr:glycosyltransferase family 87 protein [Aurantibacillus circumpalustris]
MKFLNSIYFKVFAGIFILALLLYECVVQHNKDFDIFISASKMIFNGESCYEVWIMPAGLKYYYSPLFAVLMFPLKFLPQIGYNLIWLSFTFWVIYRTFILLPFFLPVNKLSLLERHWFYIFVILCVARYIVDNLALGQMTFLMVWASLEAIKLIFQKHQIAGAILLALIINFKLIPVAILPYLIYKREFRAVGLTILFFIFYLYLPVVVLGYGFNNQLMHAWLSSLANTESNSIFEDMGRPSLSSLIPSLVMETPIEFSIKRNFLALDSVTTNSILMVARLALLLFLTFLFGKPFQKFKSKKKLFYDISLVFMATPMVFPHQGKYAIYYLIAAYAYCIYTLIRLFYLKGRPHYKIVYSFTLLFVVLSFVGLTLTTDGLIGRRLSDASEYLNLIIYGALFLLIAMALLKPRKFTTLQN